MKFTVNMIIEVDEEENVLPVDCNDKTQDEQALRDILRDYFFDFDGLELKGVKITKHE